MTQQSCPGLGPGTSRQAAAHPRAWIPRPRWPRGRSCRWQPPRQEAAQRTRAASKDWPEHTCGHIRAHEGGVAGKVCPRKLQGQNPLGSVDTPPPAPGRPGLGVGHARHQWPSHRWTWRGWQKSLSWLRGAGQSRRVSQGKAPAMNLASPPHSAWCSQHTHSCSGPLRRPPPQSPCASGLHLGGTWAPATHDWRPQGVPGFSLAPVRKWMCKGNSSFVLSLLPVLSVTSKHTNQPAVGVPSSGASRRT